jgi:putative methionine-R-sulfoxide reductase with GAF domain
MPLQKDIGRSSSACPKRLEDMSQRFSPNRGSVARTLSALFYRTGRRNLRVRTRDWNTPETLTRLKQIQETKSEAIDPDMVMDRVVKLAWKELHAEGTGVWLFTDNEIFLGAGAGQASNSERLRLALLSTLLTSWRLSEGSLTQVVKPISFDGEIKSWLVEPLYKGQNVAGVLAAFSSRHDAFAELDSAKIHSFADVLGQALTRVGAAGSAKNTALEPALALQLIEQMIPGLQHMVDRDEPRTDSICGLQKTDSDYDPFPSLLNEELVKEMTASDKTVRTTERVDTTWLATEAGATRLPEVFTRRADHQANASTAGQTPSENEIVESSNLTSKVKNCGHGADIVKNYTMRTVGKVRVAGSWLVNRGGPRSRPGLPTLFRAVTVLAVVVTTIGLFILKTDRSMRTEVLDPNPLTSASEKLGQVADENPTHRESPQSDAVTPGVAAPQFQVAEPTETSVPMQVSHMQVTDNNTKSALRALSKYELVGLRRQALYGDNSAAFLMGMAYEIGHGVRQDCKTAAQWVSNAAAEGNAVAQYNLGLRYRDGDGVPMNTEAATKWLQKAASHQIPGAQMALIAVTSRPGQVVASQP